MELTEGHLLGGRIAYAQPKSGFRSGIEPVLLAASVKAAPGERVLEAGTGPGAALLCLAARLPAIHGVGVEQDAALVALAAANIARNRFWPRLQALAGDAAALPFRSQSFDHAIGNPPYHFDAGSPSPDPLRARAKQAGAALLDAWACSLATCLRHRGTLTFILPAAHLTSGLKALTGAGCGSVNLFPLWRRQGEAAKLLLVRGIRGGRGAARVLPGLVLHAAVSGFTPQADDILRGGQPLDPWGAGASRDRS
jgi:tRNA1Val (adenine37-N6)-methyltransferase